MIATVRRASRFDAILVLDVSRWGRFDDPDRAAYGMGALIGALAGVNVISGAGMLDFLLTQSLEKLLLDHEACGMALRVIRGIQEDESDSLALIAEVVRAGEFLSHEHTRRNWRRELARVARDRSRQLRRLGNGRRNAGR